MLPQKDKEVKEEVSAPTNSAGSGGIAGIGRGPDGEPGIKKKKHILMTFRRWEKATRKQTL